MLVRRLRPWRPRSCSRKSHSSVHRRGLAVVEVAMLLPLLVLLIFGAIELANAVFLKQSLTVAAYEGGRAISRAGATEAQAEARVEEILEVRRVSEYQLSFSPEVTASTPRGTTLQITVSAPASAFSTGPLKYLNDAQISFTYRTVRL